ncbi:MAG: response regulator, partial [Chitinophagaceae bacterium]|nr:response regulator [Chitinophagaceae bacterium]
SIEAVLRKSNYRIERAISGEIAIEKISQINFDCILLDVQMPDMDGFEVAEIVKNNEDTQNIPVIFMTALSTEKKNIIKGFKVGAVEYMHKPLDPDILKIKVETFSQLYKQKKELAKAHGETKKAMTLLENHSNEVNASMRYAKNIQNTIFPSEETFKTIFPDSFVFHMPKDIVGGDFYWLSVTEEKTVLACVDCTGHGIPGALLTMVGGSLLKQSVEVKKLLTPSLILNDMRQGLKSTFNQNNLSGRIGDGMEISICVFDFKTNVLEFSGAGRPLLIVKKGVSSCVFQESIGLSHDTPDDITFVDYTFSLKKGDCVYLFSDGYADQFGGVSSKRFMKKKLLKTLSAMTHQNMLAQKDNLVNIFNDWKGEEPQVDDILVIGIKI